MNIKKIGFKGFRSLDDGYVNTEHNIDVLDGANGMGKTSFLEVIYFSIFYLQLGKKIYEELIKFNEPNFLNMSLVTENDYDYKIKINIFFKK